MNPSIGDTTINYGNGGSSTAGGYTGYGQSGMGRDPNDIM